MEKKRGSTKTILLTAITIILILIISSLIYFWQSTSPNPIKNMINEIIGNTEAGENSNPPTDNSQDISLNGKDSSTGGSSGSAAGSDGTEEGTGSGCYTLQIAYSMINMNKNSTCLEEQEGVCLNKIVDCSLEIYNRDKEFTGDFKVELLFVEEGKTKDESFDSEIKEFSLGPSEFYLFEGSTNIQSTGEDGLANKQINCFYQTIEVPKKEVCG